MGFGSLSKKVQEFFTLDFLPHLGLGKKVVPVYLVNPVPELQAPARIAASLTQNVWYTVLDTQSDVRLNGIWVYQTGAGETIELRITTERGVETISQAAVAATSYFAEISVGNSDNYWQFGTTNSMASMAFLRELRSLKVEIRKTTAAGANDTYCKVQWSKW